MNFPAISEKLEGWHGLDASGACCMLVFIDVNFSHEDFVTQFLSYLDENRSDHLAWWTPRSEVVNDDQFALRADNFQILIICSELVDTNFSIDNGVFSIEARFVGWVKF